MRLAFFASSAGAEIGHKTTVPLLQPEAGEFAAGVAAFGHWGVFLGMQKHATFG